MKIQYLVYDCRLDKPESLHKSKRKAINHMKTLYGYSSYIVIQIVLGEIVS
mgnify:CR=1 FL=1